MINSVNSPLGETQIRLKGPWWVSYVFTYMTYTVDVLNGAAAEPTAYTLNAQPPPSNPNVTIEEINSFLAEYFPEFYEAEPEPEAPHSGSGIDQNPVEGAAHPVQVSKIDVLLTDGSSFELPFLPEHRDHSAVQMRALRGRLSGRREVTEPQRVDVGDSGVRERGRSELSNASSAAGLLRQASSQPPQQRQDSLVSWTRRSASVVRPEGYDGYVPAARSGFQHPTASSTFEQHFHPHHSPPPSPTAPDTYEGEEVQTPASNGPLAEERQTPRIHVPPIPRPFEPAFPLSAAVFPEQISPPESPEPEYHHHPRTSVRRHPPPPPTCDTPAGVPIAQPQPVRAPPAFLLGRHQYSYPMPAPILDGRPRGVGPDARAGVEDVGVGGPAVSEPGVRFRDGAGCGRQGNDEHDMLPTSDHARPDDVRFDGASLAGPSTMQPTTRETFQNSAVYGPQGLENQYEHNAPPSAASSLPARMDSVRFGVPSLPGPSMQPTTGRSFQNSAPREPHGRHGGNYAGRTVSMRPPVGQNDGLDHRTTTPRGLLQDTPDALKPHGSGQDWFAWVRYNSGGDPSASAPAGEPSGRTAWIADGREVESQLSMPSLGGSSASVVRVQHQFSSRQDLQRSQVRVHLLLCFVVWCSYMQVLTSFCRESCTHQVKGGGKVARPAHSQATSSRVRMT